MSPQPTAPPVEPDEATEPTLTEELYTEIKAIAPGDRTLIEDQFMRAIEIERRRGAILEEGNGNREFFRVMYKAKALSDEMAEWMEVFYAKSEDGARRSKDEVDATKRERVFARKTK